MPEWSTIKGSSTGLKECRTYREVTGEDVLVEVTSASLCGTDVTFRNKNMGLGHEGVGIVLECGPNVENFERGDRVGWGFQQGACNFCKHCRSGQEVYCEAGKFYGDEGLDQGAFSTHIIMSARFLLLIPQDLTDEKAAPLMCAGATVYSALNAHSQCANDSVGVLGIGGLGHLAIQFARAQGRKVVAFSQNPEKSEDARELGADEFYVHEDGDIEGVIAELDLLLVTSSKVPDLRNLERIMRSCGRIVVLSTPHTDLIISANLVQRGLQVIGSVIASQRESQDMLEFAARNGIAPLTQKFLLSVKGVEEAMKCLQQGKLRYRAVFHGRLDARRVLGA